MADDLNPDHLSKITTLWTALNAAHHGAGGERDAARQQLIERYAAAVHRYLLAALRDPHAADELLQEFLLALLRGNFHKADRQRGRFRDYIKTVLFHLISKYRRGEARHAALADNPALQALADPGP
jgi:RNA polymerase sigma-70 factor (ECF subfamily)